MLGEEAKHGTVTVWLTKLPADSPSGSPMHQLIARLDHQLSLSARLDHQLCDLSGGRRLPPVLPICSLPQPPRADSLIL